MEGASLVADHLFSRTKTTEVLGSFRDDVRAEFHDDPPDLFSVCFHVEKDTRQTFTIFTHKLGKASIRHSYSATLIDLITIFFSGTSLMGAFPPLVVSVFIAGRGIGDLVHHVHALCHLAKYSVAPAIEGRIVEVGVVTMIDKKLGCRAVGITRPRHRDGSASVLEAILRLVLDRILCWLLLDLTTFLQEQTLRPGS